MAAMWPNTIYQRSSGDESHTQHELLPAYMSLEGKDAHDRSVNLNMRLYSDPAFDWVMAGTTDLFNHHEFTTNYPASSLDLEAIRQEEHNVRRDSSAYSLDPGPYRMEYATAEKLNQLEGCSPGSDLAKFPTDWSDAKQTQPPGYCHYYTHILDPLFHWKVPEQSCQPKDRERQVHHSDHSFFPLDETDAEQKDQAHTDNSYSLLSSMQCGPPAPLSSMSPSTNLGTSGFSSLLNGHTPYATSSPSLGLVSDHQSPFSASSNVLKDEADFLGSTEEVFSTARPTTLAGFNTYSSHFTGEDELDQYLSTAGTLLKSVSTVDPAVDNFQVVYNNKELWVQALYDVMIEVPSDIPKKTKIALRKKAVDQVRMEATAFQLVRRVLSLHNPVEGIRVFSSSDLALVKQADTRLTCSERLEYIRAALKDEKRNLIYCLEGEAEIIRLVIAPVSTLHRQAYNRHNNKHKAEKLAWEKLHRKEPVKRTKATRGGRVTKRSSYAS